ncbi:hypothetical protein SZ25_00258 [Candidatus Arcanobacter lacustris]|jgi:metal-responsive CopG/Arc/MetJ family transcriptional regulator|uniref:Ribbon-helix-helix protein CopG domain-containing protein n=1 Tax=Candidatus Arcanibacter lacustris TaxID=1607817 RepID=A0A0F5MP84_9RICK|nr:hypothetical protein SZ25_00258 [Candidatus Arcanobacter lacustris]
MRTIVDITEEQIQNLAYLCGAQNISRAEIIRRAIAFYLKEKMPKENNVAFGIWKNKAIDSMSYQENLRNEWL